MRAQVAFEFMVMAGFAVLLLTGVVSGLYYAHTRATVDASNQALERIADEIQQEFILADQLREGYTRTFVVDQTARGESYVVEQTNNSFTLRSDHSSQTRRTPAFSGVISPPEITVQKHADQEVLVVS